MISERMCLDSSEPPPQLFPNNWRTQKYFPLWRQTPSQTARHQNLMFIGIFRGMIFIPFKAGFIFKSTQFILAKQKQQWCFAVISKIFFEIIPKSNRCLQMSTALSTCPFLQICLQPLCSFGLVVALCCGGREEDGDILVIFVLVDLQL